MCLSKCSFISSWCKSSSTKVSETESSVTYGTGMSGFLPVNSRVKQGCIIILLIFNTFIDWVLGKVTNWNCCFASVGNVKVTDLVLLIMLFLLWNGCRSWWWFSVCCMRRQSNWNWKSLGPKPRRLPGYAYGEDTEVTETCTYLGSVMLSNGGSCLEVTWEIGLAYSVMNLLNSSIWQFQNLCRKTKIQILVIAASCVTVWLRCGHWRMTWRGIIMPLYQVPLQDHGVLLEWVVANLPLLETKSKCYQLNLLMPTSAIWACGMLLGS